MLMTGTVVKTIVMASGTAAATTMGISVVAVEEDVYSGIHGVGAMITVVMETVLQMMLTTAADVLALPWSDAFGFHPNLKPCMNRKERSRCLPARHRRLEKPQRWFKAPKQLFHRQ